MQNQPNLTVNHIIDENDGIARVTIRRDIYVLVSGFEPTLPFKVIDEVETGQQVRVFNINGVTLYSEYDRNARKTFFYMNADKARELHEPRNQNSTGEKTPFATSNFDKTIISNTVTA